MAGSLTIEGESTSDPAGTRTFGPFVIQGQQQVGETVEVVLASGDNTILVPTGSAAALYITPVTTATLKLRTSLNNTDGGLPLATGQPGVYTLPNPAPTSLIVNSSTVQTGFLTIAFV